MSKKIVIVGGGWSGSAAAIAAAKMGCQVTLLERTDMLLGTGLVGGIMRNNGRFSATEEMIAMGGGELFKAADAVARHANIEFPGHKHATLYDVSLIEPAVQKEVIAAGVDLHLQTRVKDVVVENGKVKKVIADKFHGDSNLEFEADVFIDTTGTAGPQANCTKYGNGCAMCILRCPTYGPRVSLVGKCGVTEVLGSKADGTFGAMSGSCKLHKDSLSEKIQEELNKTGVCVVPIPADLQKGAASLGQKACQQYALAEFNENVILLDTGHAKLMSAYYPLEILRKIPGFENARFEDPYSGNIGNSMRYLGMSKRDNCLKAEGLENVFVGGEKAGLLVGHTEAIITGTLAGHNAARFAAGKELLELPRELACGDAIAYVHECMQTPEGLTKKYTFSGSVYFERMKDKGLYTTDLDAIKAKVEKAGLKDVFGK